MMIFRIVFLCTVVPCLLLGQSADSTNTGWMTIRSTPSGATVFLDSVFVGKTPIERHSLSAGEHVMSVFYPSVDDWNAVVQRKSFVVKPGAEVESSLELGSLLTVHSIPSGALVRYRGTDIGQTPLFYQGSTLLEGSITVELDEHKPVTLPVNRLPSLIRLEPLQTDVSRGVTVEYPSAAPPRKWLTIGSAAGMTVAGVVAAYFKDKANKEFERYSGSNDPSLLSSTRRYDRWSLYSLVLTQAMFALLTYSLLSDN